MRILIYTPSFAPRIGGIETVSELLAEAFTAAGHEVRVLCQTPDDSGESRSYRVVRRPGFWRVLQCWRWAQVVMHMNVSLKGLLPFLFVPRPWVATHHGWYSWPEAPANLNARIKMAAARWLAAGNIAVSDAVRRYLGFECKVIPNPHDESVFRLMPGVSRDRDLLFVGRLVSDKAPELVLCAMEILANRGIRPQATFTGSGPEEHPLRDMARAKGLEAQVTFTGAKHGAELAHVMNEHRIMVVPSRVREGFGIVALEGIACGCVVVAADAGGLGEAVGECGLLFRRESADDLARVLVGLLSDSVALQKLRTFRDEHLARHALPVVASLYLELLKESPRR
jgi:glycogen(starch) synthase